MQSGQSGRQSRVGRGPKGDRCSDERIEEDINEQLTRHPEIDAGEIEVKVKNGEWGERGRDDESDRVKVRVTAFGTMDRPRSRRQPARLVVTVRRLRAGAAVIVAVAFGTAHAQQPAALGTTTVRPFVVGERLTYDVSFGPLKVGTGTMEVRGIENVRGRDAYHTVFRINGGIPLYRVDDTFESWFATDDLASLRFHQDQNEGQKDRDRRYEIFPERRAYNETTDDKGEQPSVAEPLDDGSFVYFVRTVPLEVGRSYEFARYFKPDRNPVTIRVLRRERVTVPAGTFDAIVIQPVIKTKGVFSEQGRAELWISDDDRRLILQMKSQLAFGSIDLYLTNIQRP